MFIKSLSLENFRCFQKADIDFGKITLLTGANNSGKSSLIYSLLLMLQSKDFPFYLSPNGKYINLGSFKDLIFGHDNSTCLSIRGTFGKDLEIDTDLWNHETKWAEHEEDKLTIASEIKIASERVQLDIRKKNDQYNLDLEYPILYNYQKEVWENLESIENIKKAIGGIKGNGTRFIKNAIFDSIDDIFVKLDPSKPLEGGYNLINTIRWPFEEINRTLNYIQSYTEPPQRIYYRMPKAPDKIESNGEGYTHQILEWQQNKSSEYNQLVEALRTFELLHEIKDGSLNGGMYELLVKTQKHSPYVSLPDIGFGVSKLLPMIVADLQLPHGSILAVSEPESDLHPKVQAGLADYFLKMLIGCKDWKQFIKQNKRPIEAKKQYIIETHSEYLLNRFRLLIAQQKMSPSDLVVYYFENDGMETKTHKIEFTRDGQILNAPPGFFETYMIDVMDIAMAAE